MDNEWHAKKKEDILKELKTDESGLSEREAEIRLSRYGKNIIKETYKIKPLKILLSQFNSFLIYILLAAAVFSFLLFIIFNEHLVDAIVIFAIVVINAGIGFSQQYRAEKSILELKKILVQKTKVIREGRLREIPSTEIVPGDIAVFSEGDKINADSRILICESLQVNEAILTGESLPVDKISKVLKADTALTERKNMLYTGTSILRGSVKAIVVATGMQTEFGRIAETLQTIQHEKTPMQKKLDKFAKKVCLVVLSLAILIIMLGVISGQKPFDMILMGVALAVSAIPEGLPAIITITLALATKILSKSNVIIRRLPAAETLGSVSVICSDKTGTITEEKMSVREIFCDNSYFEKQGDLILRGKKKIDFEKISGFMEIIKTSLLCNNARFEKAGKKGKYEIIGDPTEAALVAAALDLNINKKILAEKEPRIREISFSSERKMMSKIRKGERRNIIYSKGASQIILEKSSFEFLNGKAEKISDKRRRQLLKISEKMEEKGLRVLAFAFRYLNKNEKRGDAEKGLIFLGFIGMLDPPREEIKNAVKLCQKAGIKVKMITGDSVLTARSIAKEVGIKGSTITGKELEEIRDEALIEKIDSIGVFARVLPKQKLRILEILKKKKEIVAITGDGVNDVLALKKADIGIAMGIRGSDVAREVSDMILLDDNFSSIVRAVEQGRIVYDNTKKFSKFLLAANMKEILLIAYAIFMRFLSRTDFPLPLLPLQILWINLVTDSVPALALAKEKGEKVMESKPRKEMNIFKGIIGLIITASLIALIAILFIFHYSLARYSEEKTRTMVMSSIILFEAFFVFVCRSDRKLREIGFLSNKWLNYAFLVVVALQVIVIYTPLRHVFKLTTLGLSDWLLILVVMLPAVVLLELRKYIKWKKK